MELERIVVTLAVTGFLYEIDNGVVEFSKHVQEENLHRIRSCLHNGNVARALAMVDNLCG